MTDADEPGLDRFEFAIRTAIYRVFAADGVAPMIDDLRRIVGGSYDEVLEAMHRLQRAHLLVLAPGSDRIWMAHPFSAIPTEYPVQTENASYWANCAWDAFAIPHLLGVRGWCETLCPESRAPLRIEVADDGTADVTPDSGLVHFAVPPKRFWDNVAYT